MTAQIPDKYRYENKEYAIVAMTKPMEFDPKNYGLEPHSSSTACWRGYWCEYAIKNGRLVLERLLLFNADNNYPDFNGVAVSPQEYKEIEYFNFCDEEEKHQTKTIPANDGHRTYEANMEMKYTGKILLGDEFLNDYYIHMGFQEPWAYKDLKEFEFDNGELIAITDHSEYAEKMREQILRDPEVFERAQGGNIVDYIDRSFSLDASVKAWWIE